MGANETRLKRAHSLHSYSYEDHEHTKPIFGILSQYGRFIWKDTDLERHERGFYEAENMLSLNLCDGYTSSYTYKNSSSCTHGIMSFTLHYIYATTSCLKCNCF